VLISRVAPAQWHALATTLWWAARGVAPTRRAAVRQHRRLARRGLRPAAEAMLAALPKPLRTVVDEADTT